MNSYKGWSTWSSFCPIVLAKRKDWGAMSINTYSWKILKIMWSKERVKMMNIVRWSPAFDHIKKKYATRYVDSNFTNDGEGWFTTIWPNVAQASKSLGIKPHISMWDVTTIAHKSLPLLTTYLGVTIEQAEECQRQRRPWVPGYKEHGPYQIMEIIACHVPFARGDPDALVKLCYSVISLHQPSEDTKSSDHYSHTY